jgi:type VI secretion system protein
MALRLRVLGTKAERLGDRWSRVFGVHGGRLGRAADCDWVLPDPERYLSGHHAAIEYRGGHWYVVDTSMNGTFVNGATNALGRDRAYALQDGDRIRMGEYDFLVSITPDNDFVPEVEALGGTLGGTYARALDVPPIAPDLMIATHGDIGAELDMKSLLASPIEPSDAPQELPHDWSWQSASLMPASPPVTPPADSGVMRVVDAYGQEVETPFTRQARAARSAAPATTAPLVMPSLDTGADSPRAEPATAESPRAQVPEPPAPMPEPQMRSAPRAAPPVSDGGAAISGLSPLMAFCRGAGIDAAKLPEQDAALVLALAGQLLREFALGLMLGLQHRTEQKHAMRASHTAITALANNPFKVARSVEEALQRVLGSRSQRFLPPVEAVRAGFADLQRHEQATLSGLQDALGDYLVRFAPDQLEQQFERSLARVPGAADEGAVAHRARYWEMYAELFRVLAYAGPDGLPHAFAESFAEAYARQDEELKKSKDQDAAVPRVDSGKR